MLSSHSARGPSHEVILWACLKVFTIRRSSLLPDSHPPAGEIATTLRARRFAASGKPRGGELVLHRAPAGTFLDPQLTLLPGTGRFALAWQERGEGWIRIFTE